MSLRLVAFAFAVASALGLLTGPVPASATGLATCDSGPRSGWQPAEKLEKQLTDRGWKVRRIKEDGGCYEVYGLDDKGQRVEAYFHPLTLAPVPTKPR
ncbi:MAG: hypothetical protein RJA10_2300 [Pseudomonadota bacterium]|jgi:hypothetical protein